MSTKRVKIKRLLNRSPDIHILIDLVGPGYVKGIGIKIVFMSMNKDVSVSLSNPWSY